MSTGSTSLTAPASILAFDIGGTRIKAGMVQDGQVTAFTMIDIASIKTGINLIEALADHGRRLIEEQPVQAIGLSIRGIVDPTTGVLLDVNGPLSEWIGQPIAPMIAERLCLPTVIENDARMYALGEQCYGAGQGYQNVICLTLGTGVGCGVTQNGEVVRGARGTAGILGGHITIVADGPLCSCGNRGCLETLVGNNAMKLEIQRELATGRQSRLSDGPGDPKHLFEAAQQGDQLAQEIVQRFTTHLGAGIVSLIHCYDPDIVIIGGGIAHAADYFLALVQEYVDIHAWTLPRCRVRLVTARLGDTAALLGAATFVQQSLHSS